MPRNPSRSSQGGDVEGMVKTAGDTQGTPIRVAKASFDPGYDIDSTLQDATMADLQSGYVDSGHYIGEGESANDKKYSLPSRKLKV